MIRGGTPAVAMATTRARGVRPWRRAAASEASSSAQAPSLTPEALPAVTVQLGAVHALEPGELVQRRVGPRVLVGVEQPRLAALLRHLDRHDLGREEAGRVGGGPALLRAQREAVLVLAADPEVGGDVVGGLRHRIGAELRLQRRVDEPPADRGVVEPRVAGERRSRPCP